MKKYQIYGLKDPRTDEIRYIGCSTNVDGRYRQHIYSSKNGINQKDIWIKSLLSINKYPEIEILDSIETNDRKKALNLETLYIEKYKLNEPFNINQTEYIFTGILEGINDGSVTQVKLKTYQNIWEVFKWTTTSNKVNYENILNDFMREYNIKYRKELEIYINENKNKTNESK